ncbi:chromate efflux transporter [Thalassomonas sp. M1454]|uniref:chromate efflux transporter n=1 Tax=Thalassomonas sp. M1454 TaxID=2594477 RepID=UPI00117C04D7|nr:chromate efflux transporter [Thalassomonas sp. M1454]TRX58092.1 chromate efflux transporter [Thalassomonas sp. M1454]
MNQCVEVFWRFLLLGCISFGGPAAHIGYFRKTFVEQLKWLDESAYARLIALSQFLPGPGSSQIGFSIGYQRAGLAGAISAFIGFTLPSFLLLYFFALTTSQHSEQVFLDGVIHGLKLLAVVVVADATLTMFKMFCTNRLTIFIFAASALFLMLFPSLLSQLLVLVASALIALVYQKVAKSKANPSIVEQTSSTAKHMGFNKLPMILFLSLLIVLPFISLPWPLLNLFNDFYLAGSLVFGGGHVVLPLLQETLGSAVTTDNFLTGYAAAQAVPGPMFTLATFLGASSLPEQALLGATIATLGVFLPGFLLILSLQESWSNLAQNKNIANAIVGVNAAVVGLLLAALYNPVFISAVLSISQLVIVLIGFVLLRFTKLPILTYVISFALLGYFLF